jgi:hypothetical protein
MKRIIINKLPQVNQTMKQQSRVQKSPGYLKVSDLPEVKQLKESITVWRSGKTYLHEPLPLEIQSKVAELAKQVSPSYLAVNIGLGYNKILEIAGLRTPKKVPVNRAVSIVKGTPVESSSKVSIYVSDFRVEYQNSDEALKALDFLIKRGHKPSLQP